MRAYTRAEARREREETRGNPAVGVGVFLPPPVLSGIAVTPETALTFAAAYACINTIATDCSTLTLNVHRRLPGGGVRLELGDARQELVCTDPDGETTAQRFRQALFGHVLGWGNGYAEVERFNGGDPAALHILSPRPTDTRPSRTPITKQLFYELDGGRRSLPPENILHVAGLGWDGLVGYSPIAFNRQAVGLGIAQEQFGAALYGNASSPKGALKYPGKLTKEAMQRLRESWESVHQGTVNAHRLAILEQGMEWQNISINPQDAEYLAGRAFQVLEMCRIFRVPPHKIGDYSHAHLTNIEESNIDYTATTLRPWLVALEQEWTRKLFSRAERRAGLHVEHDMGDLLRGNMAARAAYYGGLFQKAAISPNEIRAREGLNPIPGGDQYFIPVNNLAPLGSPQQMSPTVKPAAAPGESGEAPDNEETEPETEKTTEESDSAEESRYNENHDELGRFAESDSSGGSSGTRVPGANEMAQAHEHVAKANHEGLSVKLDHGPPSTKHEQKVASKAAAEGKTGIAVTKEPKVEVSHENGKTTHVWEDDHPAYTYPHPSKPGKFISEQHYAPGSRLGGDVVKKTFDSEKQALAASAHHAAHNFPGAHAWHEKTGYKSGDVGRTVAHIIESHKDSTSVPESQNLTIKVLAPSERSLSRPRLVDLSRAEVGKIALLAHGYSEART